MSADREHAARLWLAFAMGDLEASPVSPLQAANSVRQANAIVRLVREDFERHGASTAGIEPR